MSSLDSGKAEVRLRLQDTINKYNRSRGYTAAVFIDFQSAYDMLWHKGLLRKLSGMGINGKAFAYIEVRTVCNKSYYAG